MADVLDLPTEEGFVLRDITTYHNQVYDFDAAQKEPFPYHRKLGMTHGSRGIIATYTVNVVPQAMGFASSDEAFESVRAHLIKAVSRHVFTDVLRNQGNVWHCAALAVVEGSTVSYISSDYLSTVTHSAYPTSQPTVLRVKLYRNRTGIIAGTIVGVTAFIIAVMVASYFFKPASPEGTSDAAEPVQQQGAAAQHQGEPEYFPSNSE